jgi:hypothetical protein
VPADDDELRTIPRRPAAPASPHAVVKARLPVWPDTSAASVPAGGIMTNVQDVAKWLTITPIRTGDGQSLYTTRTARALWMPVTILNNPPPPQLAPLKANSGAMHSAQHDDYRGYKIAEHTGGLPGFVSVTMVPTCAWRRGVHQRNRVPRSA